MPLLQAPNEAGVSVVRLAKPVKALARRSACTGILFSTTGKSAAEPTPLAPDICPANRAPFESAPAVAR